MKHGVRPARGKAVKISIAIVAFAGFLFLLAGSWIYIKAGIAKILLASAWEKTLAGAEQVRPWPWADLHPVARLTVPSLNADEIVLSGSNGPTLAFGPGHVAHTAEPGGPGNCVIAGHRDTSFRFLKDLKPGDEIRITDRCGAVSVYTVSDSLIVDKSDTWVMSQGLEGALTLVTCYPFDDPLPGPERYIVFARMGG
jgi:sortase A